MKIRSFSAKFETHLVTATAAGLAAVANFLVPRLRHVVGVHNPTQKSGVAYKRKSKSGAKTQTVYEHGAPNGLPPYHRTGTGQQAIQSRTFDGGLRLQIGVLENEEYMLMLDAGITYSVVGKRQWPWATSTVMASMDTCKQLFMTGAR
jgi:hypothetical protein